MVGGGCKGDSAAYVTFIMTHFISRGESVMKHGHLASIMPRSGLPLDSSHHMRQYNGYNTGGEP